MQACIPPPFALWSALRQGVGMDTKQDIAIKSWDQTWTYHPRVLATPTSVDDIVEIM
jgi:hypothetical protein